MPYHDKKFKKCKYCDREAMRNIRPDGRNKGHYRTCGTNKCLKANFNDPDVIDKKRHIGKDHPLWIEDRSKVKFRPRYELTMWRKAVFERDNYICQECGIRGYKLQADHIKPYALFPELRWDLKNGRTLCEDCHKLTPSYARNINIQQRLYVTV